MISGMQAEQTAFEHCVFSVLLDLRVEFFFDFLHRLFYSRGVNASVRDEFSSAMAATSLLTGSKPDKMTTSGVSSMMSSMPVAFSSVLILRPSLPMIRAFMSSFGRGTTETVISVACSVLHF